MLVLGRLRTTYVFSRILYYTIQYHSVIYHLPYCNIPYRKDHYAHVVFGARSHTHTYVKQVSDVNRNKKIEVPHPDIAWKNRITDPKAAR